jgi:hypothetical protein
MNNERRFASTDHFDRDLYTSSQTGERALNEAILGAEISESYEEYLDIFDAFYAENIELSIETREQPIRGKATVRSVLAQFLVPLHMMAEVGGLLISVRQTPIAGDVADETHSLWRLELVGVSGRTCALSWHVIRKWNESHVLWEHHCDHQQTGSPLTSSDLSFYALTSATADQRPS